MNRQLCLLLQQTKEAIGPKSLFVSIELLACHLLGLSSDLSPLQKCKSK